MRRLWLATTNSHKVREVRELLQGADVQVDSLDTTVVPEPEETESSFEGNARLKARYYASLTEGLVVSEDSGLEIDALGGAPGVHSARYLGPGTSYPDRFAHILAQLEDVPDERRTARFVCALAVADGDRIVFEARGVVEGRIAPAPAGAGGFGYDPIFFVPALGQTLAEAGPLKATVSHRGQAVRALCRWLRDLG
jgi:XTP/dITP diphosphohydrolase